jgi:hypothetical protein
VAIACDHRNGGGDSAEAKRQICDHVTDGATWLVLPGNDTGRPTLCRSLVDATHQAEMDDRFWSLLRGDAP